MNWLFWFAYLCMLVAWHIQRKATQRWKQHAQELQELLHAQPDMAVLGHSVIELNDDMTTTELALQIAEQLDQMKGDGHE